MIHILIFLDFQKLVSDITQTFTVIYFARYNCDKVFFLPRINTKFLQSKITMRTNQLLSCSGEKCANIVESTISYFYVTG